MNVKSLPEDKGMLFIFEHEHSLGFWMKNTLIPLSIGFFDAKQRLIDIQEMKPASSLMEREVPTYQSSGPALYALEMNEGWFKKHKIKVGARLQLVSKSPSSLLSKQLSLGKENSH